MIISVGDIEIDVLRKNIKNLHLTIKPPGLVRISAPLRMDSEKIHSFILSKLKWIQKHRERLKNHSDIQPDSECTEKCKKILALYHREYLEKTLPKLITIYEKKMGVSVKYYGIKKMKTRWGTCNAREQRIWFNLELAKKSADCLEYIVVHEMVHLLEQSHNKRFKLLMDHYLPGWKDIKKKLNA